MGKFIKAENHRRNHRISQERDPGCHFQGLHLRDDLMVQRLNNKRQQEQSVCQKTTKRFFRPMKLHLEKWCYGMGTYGC